MNKSFVLLLLTMALIQLLTVQANAQEQIEKKQFKNNITFNVPQLIFNEARFGYERTLKNKRVFGVILGLKYPTAPNEYRSNTSNYFTDNFYRASQGLFVGLGYSYYPKPESKIYWRAETSFSYHFYKKKYHRVCSGQSVATYTSLESAELIKIVPIKVLFGKKSIIYLNNKIRLTFDYFVGVGGRGKLKRTEIFKYKHGDCQADVNELGEQNTPFVMHEKKWFPHIYASILIGCLF